MTKSWKQRAIAALKDSIAHWERLASGKRVTGRKPGGGLEGPHAWDCACCVEFEGCAWPEEARFAYEDKHGWAPEQDGCYGCPVMVASGHPSCDETPWFAAREEFDHVYREIFGPSGSPGERECLGAMLDYLRETLRRVEAGELKAPRGWKAKRR